jgi:hypothetical protein
MRGPNARRLCACWGAGEGSAFAVKCSAALQGGIYCPCGVRREAPGPVGTRPNFG